MSYPYRCLMVLLSGLWMLAWMAMAADVAFGGPAVKPVLKTYSDIAHAAYDDSLTTAKSLQSAVNAFLDDPSEAKLEKAKAAWLAARVPYQQTEVYRFGNAIVDDWEGKVNAWPLDEGLIDYVAGDYGEESGENAFYAANVIANKSLNVGGRKVDTSKITKKLLAESLHEIEGIEANVATGYHAVEFLLWGQDLNGTGPGKGKRPATDYSTKTCTGGNCERRADYLRAATDLLVDDLTWITAQWAAGGKARKTIMEGGDAAGLVAMFTGLGSLAYGELAGERMKLGLIIHDPEEEHDCFSDNTHNSHFYNVVGMRNVYLGAYRRIDGSVVSGPSLADYVKAKSPEADAALRMSLDNTHSAFKQMVKRAESVEAYDQMLGEGNADGNAMVQAGIDALLAQTKSIQRAVAVLELKSISFQGSDSLDNPKAAQ